MLKFIDSNVQNINQTKNKMKNTEKLMALALFWITFFIHSQTQPAATIPAATTQATAAQSVLVSEGNKRISFILGIGASYVPEKLYQDPAINKSNNFVIIEEAQKQKTNITLGIVYTPWLYRVTYPSGQSDVVAKGIAFSTFLNPIAISRATDTQSFFNIVDFGVGVGYKTAGGVMIMATAEWFGARQPRKWFVNEYKDNTKAYLVNGAQQASIDINDNNIFENKLVNTFGFKVCYTFDIIKNYYGATQTNPFTTSQTTNQQTNQVLPAVVPAE